MSNPDDPVGWVLKGYKGYALQVFRDETAISSAQNLVILLLVY